MLDWSEKGKETGLTDIVVKVVGIVERVDDNSPGGDNPLALVLDPGPVVPQGHVEVVHVDVLQDRKLSRGRESNPPPTCTQ